MLDIITDFANKIETYDVNIECLPKREKKTNILANENNFDTNWEKAYLTW